MDQQNISQDAEVTGDGTYPMRNNARLTEYIENSLCSTLILA